MLFRSLDVARTMMFHANVPKSFWNEAILTSIYLINRVPSRILGHKSSFEILYNRKPYVDHLRTFGCVYYVHLPSQTRDKLSHRSVKCMFLGYNPNKKAYKCIDPSTNERYLSRDTTFVEHECYFDEIISKEENLEKSLPMFLIGKKTR